MGFLSRVKKAASKAVNSVTQAIQNPAAAAQEAARTVTKKTAPVATAAQRAAKAATMAKNRIEETRAGKVGVLAGRVWAETYGGVAVVAAEAAVAAATSGSLSAGADLVRERAAERVGLARDVFSGDYKAVAQRASIATGGSAAEMAAINKVGGLYDEANAAYQDPTKYVANKTGVPQEVVAQGAQAVVAYQQGGPAAVDAYVQRQQNAAGDFAKSAIESGGRVGGAAVTGAGNMNFGNIGGTASAFLSQTKAVTAKVAGTVNKVNGVVSSVRTKSGVQMASPTSAAVAAVAAADNMTTTQEVSNVARGAASQLSAMPKWAWMAAAGVGLFLLVRR